MGTRLPLQIAVYALTPAASDGTRRLLLLRRAKRLNGFWQGVTGGVEQGETLREAAEREFREETGLTVTLTEPSLHQHQFELAPGYWHYYSGAKMITETVFHIVLPRFEPQLSDEHSAWGWVDPQAALELVRWPQNRCSIELIRRELAETAPALIGK